MLSILKARGTNKAIEYLTKILEKIFQSFSYYIIKPKSAIKQKEWITLQAYLRQQIRKENYYIYLERNPYNLQNQE